MKPLYAARVLYPVEVLGPGRRVGIWFCGCPRRCQGCSNPELWEFQDRYRTTTGQLMELIRAIAKEHPIDGFTLTGGDPLHQPEALAELLPLLREFSPDILVYTGWRREDLPAERLQGITVLIDGEYIKERNTGCALRGSDNQTVHILDPAFEDRYRRYMAAGPNRIQNFMTGDGVVSVGIHRPGFLQALDRTRYGEDHE